MIKIKIIVGLLFVLIFVSCSGISKNAKSKYQQATAEWERGNHTEPISLLEEVVAESPDFLDAHLKLAEYKIHQDQAAAAIKNIEKAKSLDETIAAPFILQGDALIKMESNLKAQGEYNKALTLEPSAEQKFQIYSGKAIAKINLGLYEDAQEYIDKAKNISSESDSITYFNALLREKKMGVNSLTIKEYKKILSSSPKNLQVLKSMGDTWKQLDQSQKAIKYYQKFLKAGGKSEEINRYFDKQIQIRKAAQAKKDNKNQRIALERIRADVEKAKIEAELQTQKAIAASEAQKADSEAQKADAEAKKAIAAAEAKKAEAEKAIADAQAEKAIADAEASKVENAKYLQEPLLKENVEPEPVILNCPLCGRIYKGEKQKTCDYDGTPLINLSDE